MNASTSHPMFPLHGAQASVNPDSGAELTSALNSFIYLPIGFLDLIRKVRADSRLDILLITRNEQNQIQQIPIQVSLLGSTATLQNTARCLGLTELPLQTEFFNLINTAGAPFTAVEAESLNGAEFFESASSKFLVNKSRSVNRIKSITRPSFTFLHG